MSTIEDIISRRSVKSYEEDRFPPRETMDKILKAATYVSYRNGQTISHYDLRFITKKHAIFYQNSTLRCSVHLSTHSIKPPLWLQFLPTPIVQPIFMMAVWLWLILCLQLIQKVLAAVGFTEQKKFLS